MSQNDQRGRGDPSRDAARETERAELGRLALAAFESIDKESLVQDPDVDPGQTGPHAPVVRDLVEEKAVNAAIVNLVRGMVYLKCDPDDVKSRRDEAARQGFVDGWKGGDVLIEDFFARHARKPEALDALVAHVLKMIPKNTPGDVEGTDGRVGEEESALIRDAITAQFPVPSEAENLIYVFSHFDSIVGREAGLKQARKMAADTSVPEFEPPLTDTEMSEFLAEQEARRQEYQAILQKIEEWCVANPEKEPKKRVEMEKLERTVARIIAGIDRESFGGDKNIERMHWPVLQERLGKDRIVDVEIFLCIKNATRNPALYGEKFGQDTVEQLERTRATGTEMLAKHAIDMDRMLEDVDSAVAMNNMLQGIEGWKPENGTDGDYAGGLARRQLGGLTPAQELILYPFAVRLHVVNEGDIVHALTKTEEGYNELVGLIDNDATINSQKEKADWRSHLTEEMDFIRDWCKRQAQSAEPVPPTE